MIGDVNVDVGAGVLLAGAVNVGPPVTAQTSPRAALPGVE